MLRVELMSPSASHAIFEAEKVVTRVAKRAPVRNMLCPRAEDVITGNQRDEEKHHR
jgi:hypothetical protein